MLGIGLEGASGRASYDFRQDEFAYKVDYSFLRQRAHGPLGNWLVARRDRCAVERRGLHGAEAERQLDHLDGVGPEVHAQYLVRHPP